MDHYLRLGLAALLLLLLQETPPDELPEPAHYCCFRTVDAITTDGKLGERTWQVAPRSSRFVDIVSGEPAWFDSRVALAWDEMHLYFGFTLEEPDLRAGMTVQDSRIYEENDVEIFIAGPDAYYELEINALNTIYEVFWVWKDAMSHFAGRKEFDPRLTPVMTLAGVGGHIHPRGERLGFLRWDLAGLQHAVALAGTLNDPADRDTGWTVEVAVPWDSLTVLVGGRSLPPRKGDIWRIDCSRFQRFDSKGEPLERSAGWTWNRHGHYDSHIPERFTFVEFHDRASDCHPETKRIE